MFADPQSVTVATVAKSLPATSREPNRSVYTMDTGDYQLSIYKAQGRNRRRRYTVRLDNRKVAPDPLASANNLVYSLSVYFTVDMPEVGYTNAEAKDVALALTAWLTSANLLKVVGGET